MCRRLIPSLLSFLVMLFSGEIGCLAQTSYSIFGNTVPKTPVDPDGSAVTLGVNFTSTQAGKITGIRYYRGRTSHNGYTVALYSASGTQLAQVSVSADTCSVPCWEQVNFLAPVSITANTRYVAAYYAPNGLYADDSYGLSSNISNPPLTALKSGGVYHYGGVGFPSQTWESSNYWVDVVFTPATVSQQLISGLSLSNSTIGAGQPAGTKVGDVSVTMNPASPAFSGTVAVPSTDSNFTISGTALVTKQSLAAGSYNTNIIATQSGIANSPFNQAETISVTAIPQTIQSVGLSNSSFAGNSPSGTKVGDVSVVMSPNTPAFAGTLSLGGNDAALFQLVGTALETNGVVAPGSYNINIVATQSGISNSPFTQAKAITGTAPTLTVNISPSSPSVAADAPLGTVVAAVSASWSDGSPFTGTIACNQAPDYCDGALFALDASNNLIVNGSLAADSGTVQYVTITAKQ
jgi:hypothetical protein